MLLSAIVLAVGILVVVLILSCLSMMKDGNEAQEELNERIEQFYRVAFSVKHAGGESARMVYRRAQPFRKILLEVADDMR
jgi:hypothetical protein